MKIENMHHLSYLEALDKDQTIKNNNNFLHEQYDWDAADLSIKSIRYLSDSSLNYSPQCLLPVLPDSFIEEVKAIRKAHARGDTDWKVDLQMKVEYEIGCLPEAYFNTIGYGSADASVCLLKIHYLEYLCQELGLQMKIWPCTEPGWVQTIFQWMDEYMLSVKEKNDFNDFGYFIIDFKEHCMSKFGEAVPAPETETEAPKTETEAPETPQESYLVSAEEWVDLYGKEIKHKIIGTEELIKYVNKMRAWYEKEKAENKRGWKTPFLRKKICGANVPWLEDHLSISQKMIDDLFGEGVFSATQISDAKNKL